MPELPEVEAHRRLLDRYATGRRLVDVVVVDPGAVRPRRSTRPSAGGAAAALRPAIGGVFGPPLRIGKRLGWPVGEVGLEVHLGMTGHWVRRSGDEVPRFARLGLRLDDGATLWFTDARRFGCVVPHPRDGLRDAVQAGLGPDALDAALDGPALAARFRTPRPIKVALLDQARLAGLGNIHAVEALFLAGLHPDTPCDSIDAEGWSRLAAAIPRQLRDGLADLGDDEIRYLSEGAENPFRVYGRAGLPCPVCGTPVARAVRAGRTTTWCPRCQPAPRVRRGARRRSG